MWFSCKIFDNSWYICCFQTILKMILEKEAFPAPRAHPVLPLVSFLPFVGSWIRDASLSCSFLNNMDYFLPVKLTLSLKCWVNIQYNKHKFCICGYCDIHTKIMQRYIFLNQKQRLVIWGFIFYKQYWKSLIYYIHVSEK